MNLDYLVTFRQLVRLGSFSAVAKDLSISQPAVSFQIQKLEADLGTVLIDRSQKKLKLTDAGLRLLDFASVVAREHTKLENDLDKLRTDVCGELDIAASTIPGEFLVPPLLGEFMSDHTETSAHVDIMDSMTVIDGVKYGDYKLGFCGSPHGEREGLSSFKIASDEIILIASTTYPLDSSSKMSFKDLAGQVFISRETTSGTRQNVEHALAKAGFDPAKLKPRLVLSNTEAVVSAVEAGSGLSFVSNIGAKKSIELGRIRQINIDGFKVRRDFYCIYYSGKENLRLVDEFLDFVKDRTANPAWLPD